MHMIGAQFFVCFFLDSWRKILNMLKNVSGFHLQSFCRFCIQILVTLNLSAHLFWGGFCNKQLQLVVLDSPKCKRNPQMSADSANC